MSNENRSVKISSEQQGTDISCPVIKKDHYEKMKGEAEYIRDIPFEGLYESAFVRTTIPHGRIRKITLPDLPEGYHSIGGEDVPFNHCHSIGDEQPVFTDGEVRFIGEAILMIAGPDKNICEELCRGVSVEYDELPAVLELKEATESYQDYHYDKGDPDKAFREAHEVYSETFETGYQEQAYIEPQGVVSVYDREKDLLQIFGSMQCPYYVHGALKIAFERDDSQVRVVQTVTGGGFGGKEDYPSLISCRAAAAALKTGHPVRISYGRREDMSVTTRRHPAILEYSAALDEKGLITGLRARIRLDAGGYPGLSCVVLQRSVIAASNVYNVPNMDVSGSIMYTNTPSNGAFRGFGAPQSIFAVETLMNHLAARYGMTPLEYRRKHFFKEGDVTSTNGRVHQHVPIPEMLEKAEELIDYSRKYEEYGKPQSGRYRRGIGMSVFFHGCGFTGSGEAGVPIKDENGNITGYNGGSSLKLVKDNEDRVEILISNTDMGQGLKTTFSKIASKCLGIPYEDVTVKNPDTQRVPNSGPTVASRSIMITGKLVERAALKLKAQWIPGEQQEIEERYIHPDFLIPWDNDTFRGDAYPAFSYGLNVAEVELDTLTGASRLIDAAGVFDVGHTIDRTIMLGQAEGGMLQAFGYGSMEKMESRNGRLMQNSFTDYMIPTSMDTVPFRIAFIDNPYSWGPFGAKGAGELTLDGGAAAYEAALEEAMGREMSAIPATPERVLKALDGGTEG